MIIIDRLTILISTIIVKIIMIIIPIFAMRMI